MIFELNKPEATAQALAILRDPSYFQWYVIPLLVIVMFIYFTEMGKKNWKGIAGGMMLYGIHWFVEIVNALIQHWSGHALWTVPTGTAYLILVGVGIELSLMFSIAGLATTRLLPEDKTEKVLGVNVRIFYGVFNAALASIIEIFLVTTPAFVWVYPWWGALTVFLFVYIPFFLGATYAYYWKAKTQKIVLSSIWGLNIILLAIFIPLGFI
ncbi:hypothetical protein [Candidatus Lokiarchaeum ossiferum]|uniref:hypothetical protein n=1 Tax=Candidatus Lokiarchaeum ossiferum TaxID=2951803 RepID=UPI00352DDA6F